MAGGSGLKVLIPVAVTAVTSIGVVGSTPRKAITVTASDESFPPIDPSTTTLASGVAPIIFHKTATLVSSVSFENRSATSV